MAVGVKMPWLGLCDLVVGNRDLMAGLEGLIIGCGAGVHGMNAGSRVVLLYDGTNPFCQGGIIRADNGDDILPLAYY